MSGSKNPVTSEGIAEEIGVIANAMGSRFEDINNHMEEYDMINNILGD